MPPILTVICIEKLHETASDVYFDAIRRRELWNLAQSWDD
jgi:hypothetical protein